MSRIASPADLLETLLNVSLTGVILFRPVYAAHGLNIIWPTSTSTQLPQRPADAFLSRYPNAGKTGIFAFCRDTFLSGKANRYDVSNSCDGYGEAAPRRAVAGLR